MRPKEKMAKDTRKCANPARSEVADVNTLTTPNHPSKKLKHNKKDVNGRPQPFRQTGMNPFLEFKETNH